MNVKQEIVLKIPEMDEVLEEMELADKQLRELRRTLERISYKTLEVQARLNKSDSE